MLILTRKVGESFLVGDDIEIVVTDIKKGSVRIGVEAPRNLAVYRKEIYARILKENEVASRVNVESSQLEELDYLINQHMKG